MVKACKFFHITPILRCPHWVKFNERIEYKLLSLTYKVLTELFTGRVVKKVKTLRVGSGRVRCRSNEFFCSLDGWTQKKIIQRKPRPTVVYLEYRRPSLNFLHINNMCPVNVMDF